MKFKELSVITASNKPERILLDGYEVKIAGSDTPISLDGQWVEILGTESEAFKAMDLRLKREAVTGTVREHSEIDNLIKSCLISGWSFEEELTEENVVEFIKVWPTTLIDWIVKKAEGRVAVNFTQKVSKT